LAAALNALKPLLWFLSPAGAGGRLSILVFHRVLAEPDPLFPELPDAVGFGQILQWIKSSFNVLPLDDAVRRLGSGSLPSRAAVITFDDGYLDNFTVALPALQQYGMVATFFIATGFLNGGRMWNDTIIEAIRSGSRRRPDSDGADPRGRELRTPMEKRAAIDRLINDGKYLRPDARIEFAARVAADVTHRLPADLMMTSDHVRALRRAGMQIGAHTVSHPILTRITSDEARNEIRKGKLQLEELLDERVSLFAYPNGRYGEDYTNEHVALAREIGFDAAVSTNWGAAKRGTDVMQLPRFTPWDRTQVSFGLRLAANLAARRHIVS
jgi:peptidoglycan/xylan/chitin deacetylase (PgdA/CDA1 family)